MLKECKIMIVIEFFFQFFNKTVTDINFTPRREAGFCKICWYTMATTDFQVSGEFSRNKYEKHNILITLTNTSSD